MIPTRHRFWLRFVSRARKCEAACGHEHVTSNAGPPNVQKTPAAPAAPPAASGRVQRPVLSRPVPSKTPAAPVAPPAASGRVQRPVPFRSVRNSCSSSCYCCVRPRPASRFVLSTPVPSRPVPLLCPAASRPSCRVFFVAAASCDFPRFAPMSADLCVCVVCLIRIDI